MSLTINGRNCPELYKLSERGGLYGCIGVDDEGEKLAWAHKLFNQGGFK
jgi:hypothetical protein